jgi:hypothetical protein
LLLEFELELLDELLLEFELELLLEFELELLDELLLWLELELLLWLELELLLWLELELELEFLQAGAAARSDRVARTRGGSPIRSCLECFEGEGSTRRSSMGLTSGSSGRSSTA